MGALIGQFIKIALQLLAGVGLTVAVERFLPVTNPINPQLNVKSWGMLRIAIFILIMAVGAVLLVFIGKKLKLKILR